MGRLIIVEGADGTGKTTLVNKLVEQGAIPLPIIPRDVENYDVLLNTFVTIAANTTRDCVMDRSVFTDVVYRYVTGGKMMNSKLDDITRMLYRNWAIIIHCVNGNYFERAMERGEDNITDKVTAKKIFDAYDFLMFILKGYCSLNVVKYNYDDKLSVAEVEKELGGKYGI